MAGQVPGPGRGVRATVAGSATRLDNQALRARQLEQRDLQGQRGVFSRATAVVRRQRLAFRGGRASANRSAAPDRRRAAPD